MSDLPVITKAEFKRFVRSRYAGAKRSSLTGCYRLGTHEYDTDMLWVEAQCEKASWIDGIAQKPEWVKE